jgi:PLP dependent protein
MSDDPDLATVTALAAIKARMAAVTVAQVSTGIPARSAQLIAVSKTYDAPAILPVLTAGHRLFGENRVQEAQGKWPTLKAQFSDIELHLIGPLQSNKAKEAVALFDCIHTIDRPKIAEAIAAEQLKQSRQLKLFVQINTGEEPQKAGIIPRETMAFVAMCTRDLKLNIAGLMCIPPVDEEPAVHFAFLAKLAREASLPELSMGMSADFEKAIEFGSTYVRVGSAIFGARG